MPTFLFDKIIFGPIYSRRLGQSLGINLLPTDYKFCNFNCIYCECGWTSYDKKIKLPTKNQFADELDKKLFYLKNHNKKVDSITFAGNGEPTTHPDFSEIIDITIEQRAKYFPNSKISVLSNATMLHNKKIVEALKKTDNPILKLDSAIQKTFDLINQHKAKLKVETILDNLLKFNGEFILQTMFLKGKFNQTEIDNTTDSEIFEWLKAIEYAKPQLVMLYTIDRDTPANNLEKISTEKLKMIAKRVNNIGIKTQVAE